MHSLFKYSGVFPNVVVMGEGNTATLLRPGRLATTPIRRYYSSTSLDIG